MDREDVERLVRVESGVSSLDASFSAFKSSTDTRLAKIDSKLDSLVQTRTAGRAIWAAVVQMVPFFAVGVSLVALAGGR